MRLVVGDEVLVFDGKGAVGGAVVREISRRDVRLEVKEVERYPERERGRVVVAVSVAKGQRFDWVVSKCSELGVDHIAAVHFDRTVKLAKGASAMERYEKLAVSAAKQCGRIFLPKITGPCGLEKTLGRLREQYPGAKLIYGRCGAGVEHIMQRTGKDEDVIAFVGPEGGMTDQEEDLLKGNGATAVRLTETVLRTETAAVAFASILCIGRDLLMQPATT